MKKLIAKLENWAERNPNKAKILNEICRNYFYMLSLVVCLNIMQAGMKTGMINKALLVILFLMLEGAIYTILSYGLNLLTKKWNKAKDKDRKENEK